MDFMLLKIFCGVFIGLSIFFLVLDVITMFFNISARLRSVMEQYGSFLIMAPACGCAVMVTLFVMLV